MEIKITSGVVANVRVALAAARPKHGMSREEAAAIALAKQEGGPACIMLDAVLGPMRKHGGARLDVARGLVAEVQRMPRAEKKSGGEGESPCTECNGSGEDPDGAECENCGGTGYVKNDGQRDEPRPASRTRRPAAAAPRKQQRTSAARAGRSLRDSRGAYHRPGCDASLWMGCPGKCREAALKALGPGARFDHVQTYWKNA